MNSNAKFLNYLKMKFAIILFQSFIILIFIFFYRYNVGESLI